MEVIKLKRYPGAKIRLSIRSILDRGLHSLSSYLEYTNKHHPNIYTSYRDGLISQFAEAPDYSKNIEISDFDLRTDLKTDRILISLNINKILQLLSFNRYRSQGIYKVNMIDIVDAIRAMDVYEYYIGYAFSKILPRNEAIEMVKSCVEFKVRSMKNPEVYLHSFDDYFNKWIRYFKLWEAHDVLIAKLDSRTITCKITRCIWFDIMKEMQLDSDFFYATVCHADFSSRELSNPDFVLTRERTLVQGDHYCDFCDHDCTSNTDIEHPTEQFWMELESGKLVDYTSNNIQK